MFEDGAELCENDVEKWLGNFLEHTYSDNLQKDDIYDMIMNENISLDQKLVSLQYMNMDENMRKAIIEIISAY